MSEIAKLLLRLRALRDLDFRFAPCQRLNAVVGLIHTGRCRLLAIYLSLLLVTAITAFSQQPDKRGQTYIHIVDNRSPVVDLSTQLGKECTETLSRRLDGSSVEIRFQPGFNSEANTLAEKLLLMLRMTGKLLSPINVTNIRFYLLQMDSIPVNFRITDTMDSEKLYVHFLPFKKREELNVADCSNAALCSMLFSLIPHEVTHMSVGHITDHTSTRWFDDGLAEYVANTIEGAFSPLSNGTKMRSYIPEISLHRRDIRDSIFGWKVANMNRLSSADNRTLRNEFYRYGASYELVRQMIIRAEENGVGHPLRVLLSAMRQTREKSKNPLTNDEVLDITQRYLNVDVKTLGVLRQQRQKQFIEEALAILANGKSSLEDSNYALNILAGLDEVLLQDKWITVLLEYYFKGAVENPLGVELAATALAVRMNQSNFDKSVEPYLGTSEKLKGKSLSSIKKELEAASLRNRVD